MPKLKTIIVDDEPLALKYLHSVLAEFTDVDVVAHFRNGSEAGQAGTEVTLLCLQH